MMMSIREVKQVKAMSRKVAISILEEASNPWRWVKGHPFLGLHLAYFVVASLVGAMSLWAAPKAQPLSFLDALFNAVSAVTETGLPSVAMHRFALSDQITLLLLMALGSQVFTSGIPLFLRRLLLSRHRTNPSTSSSTPAATTTTTTIKQHGDGSGALLPISAPPALPHVTWPIPPHAADTFLEQEALDAKALAVMSWATACHYVFCLLGGFIICRVCIVYSPHATAVLKKNRVDSGLFALFAVVSAFGNCGYILLDENMVPLQRSWVMLLCLGTLMLMGNTLYAPTMRLWIWLLYRASNGEKRRVYEHILESKERRFTHLFPRDQTLWLLGCSVFLNACQVLCMLGLDWRSDALKGLGAGYKLVAALFQSIAARTGGMNAVNLSGFSAPTLFMAVIAMYVSTYPVHPTREPTSKLQRSLFVTQLSKVRSKDAFLFVAIFLICFFERESIRNDPVNFSFFNIVYEVVSAYANVGLTIGYSCALKTSITSTSECIDIACAFSGRWSVCGKMVLTMVMLIGRHRNFLRDSDWDILPPVHMLSSS